MPDPDTVKRPRRPEDMRGIKKIFNETLEKKIPVNQQVAMLASQCSQDNGT